MTEQAAQRQCRAKSWFAKLRDRLCSVFEEIEQELSDGPNAGLLQGRFERENWVREGGGGGEISLMRGRVFEKVGVNILVENRKVGATESGKRKKSRGNLIFKSQKLKKEHLAS